MIAVIQCASSKRPTAGYFRTQDGGTIDFVADPRAAPQKQGIVYSRPDDADDRGVPWRQRLVDYNREPRDNPFGLLPTWELYDNRAYGRLVGKLGVKNVFILSAGWGLLAADLLTPHYDITFSFVKPPDRYKRRMPSDAYGDFRMLPKNTREPFVFFGGKGYLSLFVELTSATLGRKTVFYNSGDVPEMPGYALQRFETRTRTNWHYECANAFVDGDITLR